MPDLRKEIQSRESFLRTLAEEKRKSLEHSPDGTLRASLHAKTIQYYQCTAQTGKNGRYLRTGEIGLAKALAQKEYDRKVLFVAREEQKLLAPLSAFYESGLTAESKYPGMSRFKKHLVNPFELPDDEYAERWEAEPFTSLEMDNGFPTFLSERKEPMRSKSEALIANMLLNRGIPYRYECILHLKDGIIAPDFTILCKSTRKVIYWEHMGLMDSEEYREKNFRKIIRYEMNGYFPGEHLIITFETSKQPLDIKVVEMLIDRYCI